MFTTLKYNLSVHLHEMLPVSSKVSRMQKKHHLKMFNVALVLDI